MYHGSFPDPGRSIPAPVQARPSRRTLLRCAGLFLLGSAAGGTAASLFTTRSDHPTDAVLTNAPKGSLDWARSMVHATDEDLLRAAGDLEFVRAAHPDQGELLVPLFERILAAAEFMQGPDVDVAATIAVRSIARLGEPDLALEFSAPLAGRADLESTNAQRGRVLDKLRRQIRAPEAGSNR